MFKPMHNFLPVVCLCTLGAAAASAAQAGAAQIANGRQIALKICSACHLVAVSQEFSPLLNPPAVPFAEVANRPDATRASLRHFVETTHWDEKSLPLTMPNPSLTSAQAADVVSYILSLRKP
jgi:mono/diheme cytochrome c family protein